MAGDDPAMDASRADFPGEGPAPAPLEIQDGWVPGVVEGAHARVPAAIRRGLAGLWTSRGIAALVWAAQSGLILLVLGPLPALFGGEVEVGVRSGELAAELLDAWWRTGFSRPAASVAAGLGPRGVAASLLWVIFDYAMAGGVLTVLHTAEGRPRPSAFVLACRTYLFRFLRLLVIAAALYTIVLWLDDRLFHLLGGAGAPGWLNGFRGVMTACTLGCVGLLFDLAQVRAVLTGSRKMLRNLGRTTRFLGRNFPRLALLYGVAAAPGVVLAAGHVLVQPVAAAPGAVLLPALVQALYALGRIAVRFLLWGSELSLYRGLRARELAGSAAMALDRRDAGEGHGTAGRW